MTNPNGDDLIARLSAAPPQPQIPAVQIPVAFQAGPANAHTQKIDTPNGPMVVFIVVTPQAAITTFWPEAEWKTLLSQLNGVWSGIEIAQLGDLP